MTLYEAFGSAEWLTAADCKENAFYCLKGVFSAEKVKKAVLRVLGLGVFHCYINGERVGDDLFLPLATDYEARKNYPVDEIISSHRIYVPEYDVTSMLRDGLNEISIHFGGGWYTFSRERGYGCPKAIWRVFGEDKNGDFDFCSSENDEISESCIKDYDFTEGETQDFLCSDKLWKKAVKAKEPETEYYFSNCPPDRVVEKINAEAVAVGEGFTVYDCKRNISGYPVLKLCGKSGETVTVIHSEELDSDGLIDPGFTHDQKQVYICDGKEKTVHPLFTWYAFRYFAVYGSASVECVEVIHTDADIISGFESDNGLLNWIHDTYVNTQLTNMHSGIPSDCPHIERRGYTGDGQLASHAAMNILDAEEFYRKWIEDIRDCQDIKTGHIQYTAPYIRSGGGPGGWGCAIVEVPYQFYIHYGDTGILERCYQNMMRYFDYLEAHSVSDMIISDKEGEWCLGDWCTPVSVVLPAPFVNNYFYIKSLGRCIEIAKVLGKNEDIPLFEKRIEDRKRAVMAAYFNKWDGNFLGGQQGANAFAVDIGIGDERTYKNLVERYEKLGGFDTGIFGTDILTRVLFEHGDGELASKLLLSETRHSFAEMRRLGATTLWEYWPGSLRDRSHNHPMFGAVTAYLYDYLLGIRPKEGCAGYSEIIISPVLVENINSLEGFRTFKKGKASVSYKKNEKTVVFDIEISGDISASFVFGEKSIRLENGKNHFEFELK